MSFTQDVSSFSTGGAAGAAGSTIIVPDDSEDIIGSVVTSSARANIYSTGEWSGSSGYGTYYHSWQDTNSKFQGWNMFMGDGYPQGSSQNFYVNDDGQQMLREKEYTHGRRMGFHNKDLFYYDNENGQYAGITFRVIPIRNTTDSSITKQIATYLSTVNTSYGGGHIFTYTPNSGKYSAVTSGAWVLGWQGGNSSQSVQRLANITVPANSTVLVFVGSSHHYLTTYRFKDTNYIYNMNTLFTGGLVCDLRMLEALATVRAGKEATNAAADPSKIYPLCATYYGDR
jgi:hypothetical protein